MRVLRGGTWIGSRSMTRILENGAWLYTKIEGCHQVSVLYGGGDELPWTAQTFHGWLPVAYWQARKWLLAHRDWIPEVLRDA